MATNIAIKIMAQSRRMKIMPIHLVFITMLILISFPVSGANNFVNIKLPKSIFIELPKNWVVISNNQRVTLDTAVESILDLSELEQIDSVLPFAANYYDDRGKTAGIINIRYYPSLDLSQQDANQMTTSGIKDLDAAIKEYLINNENAFRISINSWKGTKKVIINGIIAFQTEYSRKSIRSNDIFRVRLIRVFANNRSFTLTISYRESDEWLLGIITDRIISSLQM